MTLQSFTSDIVWDPFFEQSPDPSIVIDPVTDVILYANEQATALTGFTSEALCRMHRSDLETEPFTSAASSDVAATRSYETVVKTASGKQIHIEIHASTFAYDGKKVVMELWRDMTDHPSVIRDLLESEDRLKEALKLARIGSWELDLVKNKIFWSEEVFTIFEIDPLRFKASYESFLEACHPDDRAAVDSAYTRSLENRKAYSIDHRILFSDGRIKYVHEQCRSYYNDNGNPIRSIGTVIDITEKKKAEDELKRYHDHLEELVAHRTAELAASNAELERFAYISSHDLQEPLRMVSSYLQLIEKRYKDRLDADANDFINFAVDGAKRMNTLINDLLVYSRIGTRGKEFCHTDCGEVLKDVLNNMEIAIRESSASIMWETLPVVLGDRTQLIQLFQNLIGNAIKFRGAAPPKIVIAVSKDNQCWRFMVSDNGIGIQKEYYTRIFDVFQRLHNREQYPGNGIGLSICKKIVERHGGKITVESTPGAGTTFTFTLNCIKG